MRDLEVDVLIAIFEKETQLGRSFGKSNRPENFNTELFNIMKHLRILVDNETIKNGDIRTAIKTLKERTGASIGQSQKVINVYLKFYSLISNKNENVLKELDCPLDSTIFRELGVKQNNMRNLNEFSKYEKLQAECEKRAGIKILFDAKYGKKRLERFLGKLD